MSDNEVELNPTTITLRPGAEPFTLVPIIEDILRTRYCIPGSVFLVEGIQAVPVSRTGRWQALRVLLGDGELCVQTLLDGAMHRFVETGDVCVGCYVRVEDFYVKLRDRVSGNGDEKQSGKMVYLVVEDLTTIGWNESYREAFRRSCHEEEMLAEDDLDLEEANLEYDLESAEAMQAPEETLTAKVADEDDDGAMEDAFEAFEALTFPPKKPQPSTVTPQTASSSSKALPIALARDWHNPQSPLKLTTLRSIPHLPYAQNWSCNVLAVIASLSPVEDSHLLPYKQRTARLTDPSTAKQVHLTVFLDPEGFTPAVGSAVLLVGVKNHRFDGGCLKKYASDKDGRRWWYEDPWELAWCDVGGIKQWWGEVQSSLS